MALTSHPQQIGNRSQTAATYDLKKAIDSNRLVGLLRLMTGFRWKYINATISLGIATTSRMATYLLLRYFIDHFFIAQDSVVTLPLIALGFILLAAIQGGFTFQSGRLAAFTAEGIVVRLRDYLLDHIQHLPYAYHNQTETGELVQRVTSDVDALRRFYAEQAIGIGRILMLFLVNFIAMLTLNVKLAFISIIVIPIIVILSLVFFKRVSSAYEAYQDQEAILTTTLQENLTGVRVVKAFARQQYEIDKFERDNLEKFLRGKRLLIIHSLFWPISDILCGLQMLTGYLVGAMMAINGTISIGTYLAFAGMVIYLIFPMRNLGRLIVQTSTGMVSYERVMAIIKEVREPLDDGDFPPRSEPSQIIPPEPDAPLPKDMQIQGNIVFDNVCFEYEKTHPVLENISFSCEPGQAIALLGSTGSGKTTLVNLLPRFFDYSGGSIQLDGIELTRYSRRYLRQQIGIVEQEPFLFSRSVRENIAYGVDRSVSDAEIEEAARAAAVHDVIQTFPKRYGTIVGERGTTLSGGQKQRIAIARTLLKNPRILILDDSTSSVDTETEAEIRSALQNLMKGRTTFIIAHRIQSIMNADLILVLDKGQIVQSGTHSSLISRDGIYSEIHKIQTHIEVELEKELSTL